MIPVKVIPRGTYGKLNLKICLKYTWNYSFLDCLKMHLMIWLTFNVTLFLIKLRNLTKLKKQESNNVKKKRKKSKFDTQLKCSWLK